MRRLRTFVGPVQYPFPPDGATKSDGGDEFRPLKASGKDRFWLDEMLGGGLMLPDRVWSREEQAVLLLLAGPPGSGKSVFALELCYNLAIHRQSADQENGAPWTSLYISGESPTERIIENARSFGWDKQSSVLTPFPAIGRLRDPATDLGRVIIYGSDRGTSVPEPGSNRAGAPRFPTVFFETVADTWHEVVVNSEALSPDVVVIDSLNILLGQNADSSDVLSVFDALLSTIGRPANVNRPKQDMSLRPRLMIVVLDGYAEEEPATVWEFLADAAIRFEGGVGPEEYYQRSLQIVKVKTQAHAWGKHTLKIYAGREPEHQESGSHRRSHSRATDAGGCVVFPSVHWHLSQSIRMEEERRDRESESSAPQVLGTRFPHLNAILGKEGRSGFPVQHTTALVGERGAMKSHLAYDFMLHWAVSHKPIRERKKALLISLRDDVEAAKETLASTWNQRDSAKPQQGAGIVQDAIDRDQLEILYNWPGFITPAEFFHRVFVALMRPRKDDSGNAPRTAEVVVLNGLDHLGSKFPLCAREKIFVPALVSLFRGCGVCSLIVAAEDTTPDADKSPVRALADLTLEFSPAATDEQQKVRGLKGAEQLSKVTAVRVPAGQIGGLWGILWRDSAGTMNFSRQERAVQD